VAAVDGNAAILAQLLVDHRRQNVAVLGNHEVFVRHTPAGRLTQVVRPVSLSIAGGTLWQPMTLAKTNEAGERWRGDYDSAPAAYQWREIPTRPGLAQVTYPGMLAQNAVVGAMVAVTPTVMVDGQARENPYIEYAPSVHGRKGEIVCITVGVAVVGMSPQTGNLSAVSYRLTYDPGRDFAHALAKLAKKKVQAVKLWGEGVPMPDQIDAEGKLVRPISFDWGYMPVVIGSGWAFDRRSNEVRDVVASYTELLGNAVKKAITVAERNAMRHHPAFVQQVQIDANGNAVLPVVGWTGSDLQAQQLHDLQSRLLRGADLNMAATIDTIDASHSYDPETDAEAVTVESGTSVDAPEDPELRERNRLIAMIDDTLNSGSLSPGEVAALRYRPETATVEDLRAVLNRLPLLPPVTP
jgi:hypothetical protein